MADQHEVMAASVHGVEALLAAGRRPPIVKSHSS
jgi:hypothetical protein